MNMHKSSLALSQSITFWECALTKSSGDARSLLSRALSRQFVFNAPFLTGEFTTHAPAEDLAELRITWTAWTSGHLRIAVSRGSIQALRPWCKDTSRVVFTTNASTVQGLSTGRHALVVSFLTGARGLRSPRLPAVPPWGLEVVFRALSQSPFEPVTSVDLKELSRKTALPHVG